MGAKSRSGGGESGMIEVLDMGKYSWHVWGSFALTFVVLIVCVVQAKRRHENVRNDIRTRLLAMESEQ